MENLSQLADQINQTLADYVTTGDGGIRQSVLDAIDKLRVSLLGPAEYISRLRYQPLHNMCLVMAIEMGIVRAVVEKKGQAISAEELATTIKSDKLLIVRIMRILTALDICVEVDLETYKSNANAEYLNSPSGKGGMKFISGTTMRNMANVIPYMHSNNGKFLQFPDRSKGELSSAEFAYGMPLWELFRKEPESLADFSDYLKGRRENVVNQWFDIYPAAQRLLEHPAAQSTEDTRPLIVDVGGNVGYDLQNFKQQYPEIIGRYILQDQPEVINRARPLLEGTGIESMEYDFFTPQPVKGARIYYFGGICHDWPDDETRKLLSNTVGAMDEHSTLVIDELPLPDTNAPLTLATYDILMMINVCGIERTIGHFRSLLESIGLELVKVWPSQLDSALETRLKRN